MRRLIAAALALSSAAAISACSLLLAGITPSTSDAHRTATRSDSVARDVFAWANRVRRDAEVPLLRRDPRLESVAARYSRELARRGEIAHESPTRGGETPAARLAAGGARFARWAENLAWTSAGPRGAGARVVNGWMFSPGHRVHLLDVGFRHAGTGVAEAADGTWYVVQLYGTRPAPEPPDPP
ncbi:MAG TPA: CAP domain-containing protein [Longimicrobiaceae bacterium]|nr:CAP domain-containing protein [Longimicrobiaceae bacterium]